MNFVIWIIFGGIAGWLASLIAGNSQQQGLFGNIIVGIIGAVVGGYVMTYFGNKGVSGFNLYSFAVAIGGAVVVLYLWKMISNRS